MTTPAAIVLCGGASRRMGRAKADLPFGGETLLQRVVRIVATAADPVVVVAGPSQHLPTLPPAVRVVRDAAPHQGPLAALAVGCQAVGNTVSLAFLTGCDYPYVSAELIRTLAARGRAAVPVVGGIERPMPGAYPSSIAPLVGELLTAGVRSLRELLNRIPHDAIDERDLRAHDPDLTAFAPVNTPEEYAAALDRLARGK